MSYLAKLHERMGQNESEGELTKPTKPSSVSFVSDPPGRISEGPELPLVILMGLDKLPRMSCPRGVEPGAWRRLTEDAFRLRDDGWATQALAMGWSGVEVFGWSGSAVPRDQSLVEWLAGRPVRAILEDNRDVTPGATGCIVVDNRDCRRAVFSKGGRTITSYIWEAGR